MKDTVVPYKRYSDPSQGKGSSEHRQEEGAAEFIAHIKSVEWIDPEGGYCDRGKSSFSETAQSENTHHDFGRLLRDVAAKIFPPSSIIYFEDEDRFGRRKLAPSLSIFTLFSLLGTGSTLLVLVAQQSGGLRARNAPKQGPGGRCSVVA